MTQKATVEYVPLRNDLANLPSSLANLLFSANIPAQQAIIEISLPKGEPVYCGWTGLSSAKPDSIELDPTFSSNLGLHHGEEIRIGVKSKVPVAHTVLLEPVSVGDWEIVETHVAFLEAFMINQVRAVALGKLVTVFPSSTSLAALKVLRIEPDLHGESVARLSPECEVIIAPKVREKHGADQGETSVNGVANGTTHRPVNPVISVIERATIHPYLPNLGTRKLEIRGSLSGFRSGDKVQVSLAVPSTLTPNSSAENEEIPRSKKVVATYFHDSTPLLGLSYGLSCALDSKTSVGLRVIVKTLPQQSFPNISCVIRPFTLSSSANAKLALSKSESFISAEDLDIDIVSKGMIVSPHPGLLPLGGVIDTESPEFGVAKKLKLGGDTPLAESKKMPSLDEVIQTSVRDGLKKSRPIIGQEKLLDDLESHVLSGNGVLLYGSRGCGKSVMLQEIATRLRCLHVRPILFKCGSYTDKAVPTVRDALRKVSYEAAWTEPSVILFDDLDKLVPAQQEYNGDSNRQQQIAEVFANTLRPLLESGKVSILASAQDQAEIHSFLLASHMLDSIIHLRSPDKELREKILRAAIATDKDLTPSPHLDLLDVVAETEGYQPGDLWILVERLASILALQEGNDEPNVVTTESIIAATTDFTPASLRGVKLEKPAVKWDEIGGMLGAKQLVLETLEWPTKYAPIFSNCPLRLRSGLLFYGYPGCGKTMLASAIASKTGLNFISVKGPEILNKYIGASEQSVRDLFDRAQAAKPCVLFFDEFDSIAPKRGHDATGVTDRVVNQLLTQMDGAEGLDGVYVLAATSRPDLIDSALLRPGRLDKSVLCDMPDAEARLDILKRAARKLSLNKDLDLNFFAEKTEGFSGADMQALVYNAYLKGVHTSLAAAEAAARTSASDKQSATSSKDAGPKGFQIGSGDLESSKSYMQTTINAEKHDRAEHPNENGDHVITIGNEEMKSALLESKPSISSKELLRFKSIYAEFSTDRNGEMPPGTSSNEIGGRVTLQ